VLTDDGIRDGLVRLQFVPGAYYDGGIHDLLGRFVFKNQTLWDFAARPFYTLWRSSWRRCSSRSRRIERGGL